MSVIPYFTSRIVRYFLLLQVSHSRLPGPNPNKPAAQASYGAVEPAHDLHRDQDRAVQDLLRLAQAQAE